jgi:tetratricopeptide (TPR) repeat protein
MTSSSARVFRIKRLVMAASILILIAVTPLSYGYVNYNNEALAHIGYKKIELTAQNSYRGQKDVKTDFELGERAFMEERFKEGVDYFERINKGDSRYANAQFNVALGKYNLQQFESAVNAIKISLSSSPSIVLKQRAEWLLILAEINLGIESNDLFDRLRQIGQDDGHLFQNEAQILNKKLNSPFRLIFK